MNPTPALPLLSAAVAAGALGAPYDAILSPRRGSRTVARARQLAIYLHHVALGASLSACARAFARDRATIRHACARIEDWRDDPRVDLFATLLEAALISRRAALLSRGDAA